MISHTNAIIKLKRTNQDVSLVDIINEYIEKRECLDKDDENYFDMEMLIETVKVSSSTKSFIEKGLKEYHYDKQLKETFEVEDEDFVDICGLL